MKKISIIAIVAVLAVCVSGCDFVRKIAGRPTAAQIDAMNIEVVEEPVAEEAKCCCDSLCPCDSACCCKDSVCCCKDSVCCCKDSVCCKEACEKACEKHCEKECEKHCDSAETEPVVEPVAVEKPAQCTEPAPAPKKEKARFRTGPVCEKAVLENKYYVLIGTFAKEANVNAQVKKAEKAGYTVVTIPFHGGLTAVAVNPTNSKADAVKTLGCVQGKKFCPADAYILVVK